MARTRDSLADPPVADGVIPQEFSADVLKIAVAGEGVKIWGYSDQINPLTGASHRVPVLIVDIPGKTFDLFLAECLEIRARQLRTGNGFTVEDRSRVSPGAH